MHLLKRESVKRQDCFYQLAVERRPLWVIRCKITDSHSTALNWSSLLKPIQIFSINWFRESVYLPSVRSCCVKLSYFLNLWKTAKPCCKTEKLPTGCQCSAVSGDRICLAFYTSTNSISAVTRSSLPFRMSPTYFLHRKHVLLLYILSKC